jgi:hypothetical protein
MGDTRAGGRSKGIRPDRRPRVSGACPGRFGPGLAETPDMKITKVCLPRSVRRLRPRRRRLGLLLGIAVVLWAALTAPTPLASATETLFSVGSGVGAARNGAISEEPIPSVGPQLHTSLAVQGDLFVASTAAEYLAGLTAPDHFFLTAFSGVALQGKGYRAEVAAEAGGHIISDVGDDFLSQGSDHDFALLPTVGIHALQDLDVGQPGGWNVRVSWSFRRDLGHRQVTTSVDGFLTDSTPSTFKVGGDTSTLLLSFSYTARSEEAPAKATRTSD